MPDALASEVMGVRHAIITAMIQTFAAIDTPAWPAKFSKVELGPLGDEDHTKRFTMGLVPGRERYKNQFPLIERFLPIAIEFRATRNKDDEKPGVMAERLLTLIERVVKDNETWGGRAIKTDFESNEIDLTNYSDKSVQGVLFIEVHFRHSTQDPRDPNAA